MNAYSITLLLTLLVNTILWTYSFARSRTDELGKAYLLLGGGLNTWLLFDLLVCADVAPWAISLFFKLSSLGWIPAGFLALNFIYKAAERRRDALWAFFLALALLGIALNLTTDLISTGWRDYSWGRDILRGPLFLPLTAAVGIAPVLLGQLFLVQGIRRHPDKRKALAVVLAGSLALFGVAAVTDIFMPVSSATEGRPNLGAASTIFLSAAVFWALVRHEFMAIDLQGAAMVLFDHISDGVLITDRRGRIRMANQAARALFAEGELIDSEVEGLFADYESTRRYRGHETKTSKGHHLVSISQAPVRQGSQEVGRILIVRDLTERIQAQDEIIKRQRIESIGLLAGGIAHDFNNILTSLLSNITLAKMSQRAGDPTFDLLNEAEVATFRARHLTQQLLTFSKGGEPIRKSVPVKDLVQSALQFALSGSNVVFRFDPPAALRNVLGDEGQLNQVLNNLVINAIQAMPAGGTIWVEAADVDIQRGSEQVVAPGEYVELKVADEGEGIPEEHLPKIFDPYFSTKPRGTGLGLASTFSIIKRHGGHISVGSRPGEGTVFRILLPATGEDSQAKLTRLSRSSGTDRGRVLLMDDEEAILRAGSRILRKFGFEALTARDGAEALELYRQALESDRPIDVVVMDLTIPGGMGGKEAIVRLLELDPQARAIVSSGYSNDPVMSACTDHGFRAVVSKPYEIDDFIATIDRVRQMDRPVARG